MRVVTELTLSGKGSSVGMGNPKTYVTQEIVIEEWVKGNTVSGEDYLHVSDSDGEHLFDVRMGCHGQVYMELPNGDIITIRGEQ
jgi:hypothetical protein